MEEFCITEDLLSFLEGKEFIFLATSDATGQPYVVPKFLIKIEGNCIYLADYVVGRTYENLKYNPKVSLSIINRETLMCYQMRGGAKALEAGSEFDKTLKDLEKRKMHFSVERIVEGVQQGTKHDNFEVAFPALLAVFKVEVEEIIRITPSGKIKKE